MAVILQPRFDNDTQNSFHSVVVEKLVLWLWSQIEELQLYIKARNITAICYLALPPKQGGDLGTVFALLSHCSGVLACIDKACTPLANSSFRISLTILCL